MAIQSLWIFNTLRHACREARDGAPAGAGGSTRSENINLFFVETHGYGNRGCMSSSRTASSWTHFEIKAGKSTSGKMRRRRFVSRHFTRPLETNGIVQMTAAPQLQLRFRVASRCH